MWGLLLAGRAFFDDDHLPAAVHAATRADVMRALHFPAAPARDKVHRGNEDMAAPVALTVAADSLLGKCSHGLTPVLLLVTRL